MIHSPGIRVFLWWAALLLPNRAVSLPPVHMAVPEELSCYSSAAQLFALSFPAAPRSTLGNHHLLGNTAHTWTTNAKNRHYSASKWQFVSLGFTKPCFLFFLSFSRCILTGTLDFPVSSRGDWIMGFNYEWRGHTHFWTKEELVCLPQAFHL